MKSKLKILRDLPLVRLVKEGGGPITVQFERHSDRNAVLRRVAMLKGSDVTITHFFPEKVLLAREKLALFAKQVGRKKPDSRVSLHEDKLFIDNNIYVFNEERGEVERITKVRQGEEEEEQEDLELNYHFGHNVKSYKTSED